MASIEELYDSHVGRTKGMSGNAASRVFRVTVDGINDDPIAIMRNDGGTMTRAVPPGTKYPHESNLFAWSYQLTSRINDLNWVVTVSYGLRIMFQARPGVKTPYWVISLSSTAEGYQLRYSLPVGPYKEKLIGPRQYQKYTGSGLKYTTRLSDDSILDVEPTPACRSEPFQRARPLIAYTFSIVLPRFDWAAVEFIDTYLQKTNSDELYISNLDGSSARTAKRYQLRFDAYTVDSEAAASPDDEVVYRVRLMFTKDVEGHTPYRVGHVWIDEKTGYETKIIGPRGDLATEDFPVYHDVPMSGLLDIFNRMKV